MDEQSMTLRVASPADAAEILRIYAYYVENTAISFEYDAPSLAEFEQRIRRTLEKYPYIVAVSGGEIVGYAYTGRYSGRAAYDWSAETTIYIKKDKRKLGVGKRLYQAIEGVSRAQNLWNLYACAAYPAENEDAYLTKNSVQFHTHMGYARVGEFHACGYKFGRWYGVVWMEKQLGDHTDAPAPFIPFPALGAAALSAVGIEAGA